MIVRALISRRVALSPIINSSQLKKPTTIIRSFVVRAERVKSLAQLAGFWSQNGASYALAYGYIRLSV